MWIYHSPIGLLKIVRSRNSVYYFLFNNDPTPWTGHTNPQAVADDVYCHVTGCPDWDYSDIHGPIDLSEWSYI